MPPRLPGPPGWTLVTSPAGILAATGILTAQRRGLKRVAILLQSSWKEVLSLRGKGKTYSIRFAFVNGRVVPLTGVSRPAHRASAPGDPPAKDTGESAASIQIDDRQGNRIRVGTNKRSLLALEYGVNVPGSKVGQHPDPNFVIEPRPHAEVAWNRIEEEAKGMMIGTLRRGI